MLLMATRCPLRKEYEQVEQFVSQIDGVRKELGLPPISQEELVNGKPYERRPIGFELPEHVGA